MEKYLIGASILSADLARLGEEVEKVISAGADVIHFDVMDNHYVPNLTFGSMICQALRNYGIKSPIDVHLMTNPVDRLIIDFAKAGATCITFHPDATDDINRSLQLIKESGCQSGLAFNPETPLDELNEVLDRLDVILLMSVHPGFGGQTFIPEVLDKIVKARKLINNSNKPSIRLAVDGGVNSENICDIAKAGADIFVSGSAIFKRDDYTKAIQTLQEKLP